MNIRGAGGARSRRLAIWLGSGLFLILSLFHFSGVVTPSKADPCPPGWGCPRPGNSDFVADGRDFSLPVGGLKGLHWHVNGGYVATCWSMRARDLSRAVEYSHVRMAAQIHGGANKRTVEKVIDDVWRYYCDAATAKTYNRQDVDSFLRVLGGQRVQVRYASARALTQGR